MNKKSIKQNFITRNWIIVSLTLVGILSLFALLSNKINLIGLNKPSQTSAAFGVNIGVGQSTNQTISPSIWGVNFEGYSKYTTPASVYADMPLSTIQSMGIKALRFPGGCAADFYDWRTSRLKAILRGNTYDHQYMSVNDALTLAQNAGAELVYQLNIEPFNGTDYCNAQNLTNNPDNRVQNAVDLVRTYTQIKNIEIGNEQWANWDSATYQSLAVNIAQQIKQINPAIKIGLIGFGSTDTTSNKAAWTTMIRATMNNRCGQVACFDYVTDHSYPTVGFNPLATASTNQYLMQTILSTNSPNSFWSRSAYYRVCPIDNNGIKFDSCTQWTLDQHSVKNLPESIAYYNNFNPKTITAFIFTVNNQQQLRQSALSYDGYTTWYRTCPVGALGPDWSNCSPYSASDNSTIRGIGNERYGSYGAFVYKQKNSQGAFEEKLVQTFYSIDGRTSWRRVCPPANISTTTCTPWAQGDLTSARGVGNESYAFFTAYTFTQNGVQNLRQAIYSTDGQNGWFRTCPIDDNAGPFVIPCSGWEPTITRNIIGYGNESYSGISSIVFTAQQSYGPSGNTTTRGAAASYPRYSYETSFTTSQSNYAPLPIAITEWNLNCGDNPPSAPSLSTGTIDHGLFTAEALFKMADKNVYMANFHDLTKGGSCSLFNLTGALSPAGEAFAMTSALAGQTKIDTSVSDSGSVSAIAGLSPDKRAITLVLTNRNETQDANTSITLTPPGGMTFAPTAQIKSLNGIGGYTGLVFRHINGNLEISGNSITAVLAPLSINQIQIALNPVQIPIPSPPASISAACNSSGTAATISWPASAGATGYALRINNTAYPWLCPVTAQNPYDRCLDLSTTSYSLSPVVPNKQYLMWVHATNSSGGSQATSGTFTCLAPTPSPSPTRSPSPTPTRSPSPTPTRSPSPTPSRSPAATPTRTPIPTATPIAYGCDNPSFLSVNNLSYAHTIDCLTPPRLMYLNDARFSVFLVPHSYGTFPFIKTENLGIKEDKNLSWSISSKVSGNTFVMYRKIPGQVHPNWLTQNFRKLTNDDYSNLQQFVLRKNDQGLIGVYDIYLKSTQANQAVALGPASDNTVTAYSMYLVGFSPGL